MTCPVCEKLTDQQYRPFCSKHCADVDLGRWMSGSYVVAGPEGEEIDPEEILKARTEEKPH